MKRYTAILCTFLLLVLGVFAQAQEVGVPSSAPQPTGWETLFVKGQQVTVVNLGTMTNSEIKTLVATIIPQGDSRLQTYRSYVYTITGVSYERRMQIRAMIPDHSERINTRNYRATVRPSNQEALQDFTEEYFCWMYFANGQGGRHIYRFGKVSHLEPIIVQAFQEAGATVPTRLTTRLEVKRKDLGNGTSAYLLNYFRNPLRSARCLNGVAGMGVRSIRIDLPNQVDLRTIVQHVDRVVSQPGKTEFVQIPVAHSCAPLIAANWQGRVDALPGNTQYREVLTVNLWSWNGSTWQTCKGPNPINLGTAPPAGPPLTGPNPNQNAGLDPALGGGGVGGGTGPGPGGTPISIPPPR